MARRLGELLTGTEARGVAERLEAGCTLTQALVSVGGTHRNEVRGLLERMMGEGAGLCGGADAGAGVLGGQGLAVCLLRAIEGARANEAVALPVWSMPSGSVEGELSSARDELVRSARRAVVCSTYNFQRSSSLWVALAEVAARPSVSVRLYVDTRAADDDPAPWRPTTDEMARELPGVCVFRTKKPAMGQPVVRNHAKFIAIDHRTILVTSANFSESADLSNVELGLRVEDPALVRRVERQMANCEGSLYERVEG